MSDLVERLREIADDMQFPTDAATDEGLAIASVLHDAATALQSFEEENGRLREALKPYLWQDIREQLGRNGDPVDFDNCGMEIFSAINAIRDKRARAALAPQTSGGE